MYEIPAVGHKNFALMQHLTHFVSCTAQFHNKYQSLSIDSDLDVFIAYKQV